jgi:hypothetical protein
MRRLTMIDSDLIQLGKLAGTVNVTVPGYSVPVTQASTAAPGSHGHRTRIRPGRRGTRRPGARTGLRVIGLARYDHPTAARVRVSHDPASSRRTVTGP